MATDKDVKAKKDPETGEPAIDYLVEGLTEEELKGVTGGLAAGEATTAPMKCEGVTCLGLITRCYTFCRSLACPKVDCEKLQCGSFDIA